MTQSTVGSFSDLFKSGQFYGTDRLSDGSVSAEDGQEFKIHKYILSKRSGYFRSFYKNNFLKENLVLAMDGETLEAILIYLYTDRVALNNENMTSIIIAADYLLIDNLLVFCKNFALQNISLKNCVALLGVAFWVERLGIREQCYRWVQMHFGKLVRRACPEIPELPLECLKRLLQDDNLGVCSENEVWTCINIWVGNVIDRHQFVPELLSCLRLTEENRSMMEYIGNDALIHGNPITKRHYEKMLNLEIHPPTDLLSFPSLTIRCPRKLYIFLEKVSFPKPSGKRKIFITYDGQLDVWREIGETSHGNIEFLFSVNHKVYMFDSYSSHISAFDMTERTWFLPKSSRTDRMGYHVVRYEDRIYALGGFKKRTLEKILEVEYYSTSSDIWFDVPPLPHVEVRGVAAVGDRIYVIGLIDEYVEMPQMRAVAYDISSQSWIDISKPANFRKYAAVVAFNQKILVIGGEVQQDHFTTYIEVYDPLKSEWGFFDDLPFPYAEPYAFVFDDSLVVYDVNNEYRGIASYPPCVWDAKTRSWRLVDESTKRNEVYRYFPCVVEDPLTISELVRQNRDFEGPWKPTPFEF